MVCLFCIHGTGIIHRDSREHIEIIIVRYTLIGISLECQSNGLQLFTSFLSASVVHFVTSKIEGRCGTCGILYEDDEYPNPDYMRLNQMPWVAAIKETVESSNDKYFTGTIVSKEYVVTAARVFQYPQPEYYEDNFKVIPGASKRVFDDLNAAFSDPNGVLSVYHISIHPSYNRSGTADVDFDVALLRLRTRLSDHIPSEAGYVYRPICLPLPGIQEDTLLDTMRETTYLGKKDKTKIISKTQAKKQEFENAFFWLKPKVKR